MNGFAPANDPGQCMKCGFCMSACPVYQEDHIESHVARGRNMLIRRAKDDLKIAGEKSFQESLNLCLLCGRCLAVCPAKVPSPAITVEARKRLVETKGLSFSRRWIYRGIFKHRSVMARMIRWAARLPGINAKAGKPLRHMADMVAILSGGVAIPKISVPFLSKRLRNPIHPPEDIQAQGRIAFFSGCGFEFFFPDVGVDTALTLAEAGFEVMYPKKQTCCGMAVRNAGDFDTARLMARQNIEVLSGFDHVVTGCAACGSTLKNYGDWFSRNDPFRQKALDLASKVADYSEFLVNQGFLPKAGVKRPATVTYHDPCHLKWHQGIGDAPRKLINTISDRKYVEMEGADQCCGLGGAFRLSYPEVSLSIQTKKMESVKKTGARTLVTACPGCMIQLMDGVRRHNMSIDVIHISQLVRGKQGNR